MIKKATAIISDLHIGGGTADSGDDHICHKNQFIGLLSTLSNNQYGQSGQIELFINGDLFEFVQVKPELYAGGDYSGWTSEAESCARLEIVLKGHPGIFEALRAFQSLHNGITIAAGNHDVDLYWPKVRDRIKEVLGEGVQFALGNDWHTRYNGRLHIAHGHMNDPANKFSNWGNPFVSSGGTTRLEMCPGTLFMLKVVNVLEAQYPFVDNIKPVTALAGLLWSEGNGRFAAASWLLTKFAVAHPVVTAGVSDKDTAHFYERFKGGIYPGSSFFSQVKAIAEDVYAKTLTDDEVAALSVNEATLQKFMMDALELKGRGEFSGMARLEKLAPPSGTLAIVKAGRMNEVENLRTVARLHSEANPSCEVIVMGHTHQPDKQSFTLGGKTTRYYNPGSWTRYADVSKQESLTLDMMKDESKFPYELNYIWVEENGDGPLISKKETFDNDPGRL